MKNTVPEEKFVSIIDTICYWLGYQFKIGRSQLIHEASLRYPIADAITSRGTGIEKIVLEKLHPIFKSKKIDLVIYDRNINLIKPEELDNQHLLEVYEFKLAKYETNRLEGDEHQRVFDDVIRLAYHHKWGAKDCYFLMCGTYEDFKSYFIGQKSGVAVSGGRNVVAPKGVPTLVQQGSLNIHEWVPDGLYNEWFDFKIGGEKEITFNNNAEWGLQSFQGNYTIRDEVGEKYTDSIRVRTICKAITPNGLISSTHAAGIWKIEAM